MNRESFGNGHNSFFPSLYLIRIGASRNTLLPGLHVMHTYNTSIDVFECRDDVVWVSMSESEYCGSTRSLKAWDKSRPPGVSETLIRIPEFWVKNMKQNKMEQNGHCFHVQFLIFTYMHIHITYTSLTVHSTPTHTHCVVCLGCCVLCKNLGGPSQNRLNPGGTRLIPHTQTGMLGLKLYQSVAGVP